MSLEATLCWGKQSCMSIFLGSYSLWGFYFTSTQQAVQFCCCSYAEILVRKTNHSYKFRNKTLLFLNLSSQTLNSVSAGHLDYNVGSCLPSICYMVKGCWVSDGGERIFCRGVTKQKYCTRIYLRLSLLLAYVGLQWFKWQMIFLLADSRYPGFYFQESYARSCGYPGYKILVCNFCL